MDILTAYTEHLREHGRPPESVYRFCKGLGIEEREFFEQYSSFDAVESAVWEQMLSRVIGAIVAGPEWASFSARQRLLTFLFAFTEEALGQRSLFLLRFHELSPVARPAWLRSFEARFKDFAAEIIAHGRENREIADRGRLTDAYPQVLYVHFRSVIDFWVKDDSRQFERTDAFIEKTVSLAFDVIRTQAIDTAFDLLRFLKPHRSHRSHPDAAHAA